MLPRSFLYVPGNQPDLFVKADRGPADALVFDLEDAVPHADKESARHQVQQWLENASETPSPTKPSWVRVSAESIAADLEAVARPGLAGVFLAKTTPDALAVIDRVLGSLETARGLDRVPVIGLVESARAIVQLGAMAGHPRLLAFGIGEADLLGDLRAHRGPRAATMIDLLRSQVVLHSAAEGMAAPVAPTSTDFRDLEALRESTQVLLELGFRSRTAIHPHQIAVIHEVFTPPALEVEAAADVVRRFDAAEGGVTTDRNGRLIDAAVVREARETLSRRPRPV